MMWPVAFHPWLPYAVETVLPLTRNRLLHYPVLTAPDERPSETAARLAQTAVQRAIAVAVQRQAIPCYFNDRREFARWLGELAWREALALAIQAPHILACFNALTPRQRRILLWLYVEALTARELARLLQSTTRAALAEAAAAYHDLRAALPIPPGHIAGAPVAFPVPPALVGAV
jgi:DNA-directed RNA polymerase specialized sigma24 family protein